MRFLLILGFISSSILIAACAPVTIQINIGATPTLSHLTSTPTVMLPTATPTETTTLEPTNPPPPTVEEQPTPTETSEPTEAPTVTATSTSAPTPRVLPTKPVASNPCKLQPGESGVAITNAYLGQTMRFTIGGGEWHTHDYDVPGDGAPHVIHMPPGHYTYTAFIPGAGKANGQPFDYLLGVCYPITFKP